MLGELDNLLGSLPCSSDFIGTIPILAGFLCGGRRGRACGHRRLGADRRHDRISRHTERRADQRAAASIERRTLPGEVVLVCQRKKELVRWRDGLALFQ